MIRRRSFIGAGLAAAGLLCVPLLAGQTPAVRLDAKNPTAVTTLAGAGEMKGKIEGTVTFTQDANGVRVDADISGLTPGKHGFHIHDGVIKDGDLKTAGPHWNPNNTKHGGVADGDRHAGDMGNITADDKGRAKANFELAGATVTGKNSVVGHSVIVHAKEDDLKTQPAGDSGDRVAGGNITLKVE